MRISVCISTFHRHEGLEAVLQSVKALDFPGETPELSIVVVNNDPDDAVPESICSARSGDFPGGITYLTEHRRGLSFPRNRALDHAVANCDFIAFIDDDSIARPGWLAELLKVQATTDADVVTGPVVPNYEVAPEPWLVDGGFFAPQVFPTGQVMKHAFTNNVIIKSEFLQRTGLRFDPNRALTGGEDTHFFKRVHRAGATIVWAADSIVEDLVIESRMSADWLVRRQRREGMSTGSTDRELADSVLVVPVILAKSVVWIGRGSIRYLVGLIKGRAYRVRGRMWIAWGVGLGLGVFGRTYAEYLEER
ncbi:MAG: glycosyltransferase family 2 protein [Phycisphaerales bacterium]|nr:glycosyltransferase family 2 protein [Phycisphaerales bacterium]